ncbi:hypothetical protein ACVDG3_18300 [Meridianimarinicoccus sp. RP-17]|uniref:hypothetical protein n=1 Tax=Meridianimarinicoccus zhengii TaxID=2056810 RepID=UPI0013A6FB05|nr:hypothetical protein [Phycocomes zhengii]
MTRTSPPQNSFAAGEISPLLHQRFDYQRFMTGLRLCRGFVPLRQGGVTRAPGTVYRGTTKDNQPARLLDFEFATNDAVTLEFTPGTMRVWRYGTLVMAGASPFELAHPYDAASLSQLQWVQSADVIYLADGARPIQRLARFALDNWTITPLDPDTGPFRVGNGNAGLTVQASGETGSVTLTASAALFAANHVGSLMSLEPVSWSDVPLWTGNTDVGAGVRMRSDGRVYQVASGDNTGVNRPLHTEGTERVQFGTQMSWLFIADVPPAWQSDETVTAGQQVTSNGAIYVAQNTGDTGDTAPNHGSGTATPGTSEVTWLYVLGIPTTPWGPNQTVAVDDRRTYDGRIYEARTAGSTGGTPPTHTTGIALVETGAGISWTYISDDTGVVRITSVSSATQATATVLRRLPSAVVAAPTHRWAEGAWSARYGWPAAVEIFQERLIAAATPSDPRTLWFSTVGDFNDFTPGIEADSSFAYGISGENSVNKVIWLRRGRSGLHIGALGEEYSSRTTDGNQVLGPATTYFGYDSAIGSAQARPLAPRGDPMFIAKDRTRIFEIVYSLQSDRNRALELSLPAQHIGTAGFAEMVYQSAPQRLTWIRRDTGDLAVMLYDPDEDVLGWATVPLAGGVVEAMAVSPNATGTADILTLVVRRTVNGATVRMVEEQSVTYGTLTGAQAISEANHFFAATIYTGAATDTFSVPQLVGEDVFAWTDAGAFGPITVPPSGTITIDAQATRATVGLFDATHQFETLPIQAEARDGNTMARAKRLHSGCGIAVHRTAAGLVRTIERELGQPARVSAPQEILLRAIAADLVDAFSGVRQMPMASGQAPDVSLRFEPVGGAPLTVLAVTPSIEEHGV